MIKITSRKEGFRRCGLAHPAEPKTYPDTRFTPEEMVMLRAEPMLEVEIIMEVESADDTGDDREVFEQQTAADLRKALDQLGVVYPKAASKKSLVDLIMENTSRAPEAE